MKKIYAALILFLFFNLAAKETTLKVGIMVGNYEKIMHVAKELAHNKYHLDLDIVGFTNYQMPNEALNAGDLQANIFQTIAFLKQGKAKRAYQIESVGNTFIYAMGLFSKKVSHLKDLKPGSLVIIPNDPSNQERALRLLESAGLVALKKVPAGALLSPLDVISNTHELKIQPADAAQIPRMMADTDLFALNNDFFSNAQVLAKDALFLEDPKTAQDYINIIAAPSKRTPDLNEKLKVLVQVMHSPEVVQITQKIYPGALPAW